MRRTYRRPKPKPLIEIFRINQQIKVPELRVIDDDGQNIGVMPTAQALQLAQEQEMDLVEVFPKAQPPVAKITDYGRMKYQKEKYLHKQKTRQKKVDIKDIRLSLRISPHDFDLRVSQAAKFLEKGHKIKIEIILRGRERQLRDKATEIVNTFYKKLGENEKFSLAVEQNLTRQVNGFTMVVVNKV
ncbi:translation initiation factor IF-3 [Candidatus Falkowbacteria bacterium RIFOXYC2_FULL_47_12]|uniref:Translation initiation factor IF-3 n=2 Tax=Candidatus Falkowiibacteriota TaxID=1752728 RepID=A0A1F5TPF8_9BACT|nr:MAG: translation initiation factor IF-3 [Candidatus Falkowbacteria bacterium RIFOXYA2_FULL_47_9]OGF40411.1 MAG: translation initiation factor IF-3 [Candidatus Falkowbacteria bacterium RIFOXYC2_FULL_47_12]